MQILKKAFPAKIVVLTFLFFTYSTNNVNAVSTYYTDNDYESTSIYADIRTENINDNKKTLTISSQKTTNTSNNEPKKIYNTIIVKGPSNKQKAEKKVIKEEPAIKSAPVQEKQPKQEATKKVDDKKNTSTQKNEENKITAVGEFFKTLINRASNPFYQKKNDSWYVYALINYGVSSKGNLELSAQQDQQETSTAKTSSISSKTGWEGSGFGFTAGLKTYLTKTHVSIFLSPEVFYSNLNLNQNSVVYNSKQWSDAVAVINKDGVATSYGASYILPVEVSIKPQYIFGGSVRIGLTFLNTISVFGKASIGGTKSSLSLKPRSDLIDWDSHFGENVSEKLKNDTINNVVADITNPYLERYDPETDAFITTNEANPTFLKNEEYSNKLSLTYGLGVGAEVTLWNQHLVMRVDYDHYFVSGSISTKGTKYPRMEAQTQTVSASNTGITNIDSGTKWKAKNNFGMFKFSVGVSF